MGAGDDTDRHPVRVGQVHRHATDRLRQRADVCVRRVGEPSNVRLVGRGEAGPAKRDRGAVSDDHARRAGVGTAQVQLVGGVQRRAESERSGEGLGVDQVRFLELQPGQVTDFDHGIA